MLLPVGDNRYALPVPWVREIVAAPATTPLVTAPATVMGLFNLRGDIVPLLDTAALLAIGTTAVVAFAVVVDGPHGLCALAATGEVKQVRLESVVASSELGATAGCFQVGKEVVVLIEPGVLLTTERIGSASPPLGSAGGPVH